MIEDMASLKQAMEQMDAQDPAVAEAAKHRAADILGASKLSFSKMAELIEQRRLLLRPRIVASIKRMDQPDDVTDHDGMVAYFKGWRPSFAPGICPGCFDFFCSVFEIITLIPGC